MSQTCQKKGSVSGLGLTVVPIMLSCSTAYEEQICVCMFSVKKKWMTVPHSSENKSQMLADVNCFFVQCDWGFTLITLANNVNTQGWLWDRSASHSHENKTCKKAAKMCPDVNKENVGWNNFDKSDLGLIWSLFNRIKKCFGFSFVVPLNTTTSSTMGKASQRNTLQMEYCKNHH